MGFGIMEYWADGKNCVHEKIKNGYSPFENQHSSLPLFHYSMAQAGT
jgi:hypothetical protein